MRGCAELCSGPANVVGVEVLVAAPSPVRALATDVELGRDERARGVMRRSCLVRGRLACPPYIAPTHVGWTTASPATGDPDA